MYEELELLETDSEMPAYNAVCDLVEEVERLQAACTAKEAELAELREQTAELFGARLDAEGMSEEAVAAAKAMWMSNPQSAAMATLGCDITEAANPWGCNQYGHRKGHGSSSGGAEGSSEKPSADPREENDKARENFTRAQENYRLARKKVFDLADQIEKAARKGDTALVEKLKREQEKAREERSRASEEADRATKAWSEANRRLRSWRKQSQDSVKSSRTLEELLDEEDIVNASNPYGCNQHGHEWKGKHGEGWKPRGRDGEQKEKQEASAKKTLEEEVAEYENGTDDDRWVTLRKWKRERQEAKDKALDIRESSKYKQKDPEAIKAYEKAKTEANSRAKRIHEIIKTVAKRRGLSQRATDHMLRLYPETIIDF